MLTKRELYESLCQTAQFAAMLITLVFVGVPLILATIFAGVIVICVAIWSSQ